MEHLQLKITAIRQETAQSKSYFIENISGEQISYKAGQFLTLIVNFHQKEVRRSYSISSSPGVDIEVYFTVKRIENGEVSRYLFDSFKVGALITSLPPTGRFTIEEFEVDTAVFIAAGSGITPVFSLIKELLYQSTVSGILLIYQNKNEHESIFRKALLALQTKFKGRFLLEEIFSQPIHLNLPQQRLNNSLLERILLKYINERSAQFYISGPESFMRMASYTLKAMGYNNDGIKKESFFATPPPPPFVLDTTSHKVVIHFRSQTHHLHVAYPQTILDAALQEHIQLPYSCRGGRCSTCTAICKSGKVTMSINDVLTSKDLENGLILTCVSYPETDVEIGFE